MLYVEVCENWTLEETIAIGSAPEGVQVVVLRVFEQGTSGEVRRYYLYFYQDAAPVIYSSLQTLRENHFGG